MLGSICMHPLPQGKKMFVRFCCTLGFFLSRALPLLSQWSVPIPLLRQWPPLLAVARAVSFPLCCQWPSAAPAVARAVSTSSHCIVSGPHCCAVAHMLVPLVRSGHWNREAPFECAFRFVLRSHCSAVAIGVGRLPLNKPSDLCLSARRHLCYDLALHFRKNKK